VFRIRLLPWEYGVRNLLRRPTRSVLTLGALATVVLLVFVVVGFIRGLEASLGVSGEPDVVLVYSVGAEGNIENSAVEAGVPGILTASIDGIQRRFEVLHVSPELYLGTRVAAGGDRTASLGLVRGVTDRAPLVRRSVRIVEGQWPKAGEVLAGTLAHAKLGYAAEQLAVGRQLRFEGRTWRISGRFSSGGSALESELWCPLADLQQALKRQDLSLIALMLAPGSSATDVAIFCKERVDLELQAVAEPEYYALLQKHYRPVRMLAWLVVLLVAGAGVFAGVNTMYGAVVGRIRELAALQAIGFRRRAIVLSLIQEAALLAAAGSLIAGVVALVVINGMAVRFTMGAFALRIDSTAILIGCGTGVFIGVVGAIPPAIRAMRLSVAESLKAL
jgi:ABC-type antimicrobial peptide transport system permease subunit